MDAKQLLLEELKKEGLDVAEDAAISATKAVFKALPKFFLATENKYDDLLVGILPVIEPSVIKLLDQIDGNQDVEG